MRRTAATMLIVFAVSAVAIAAGPEGDSAAPTLSEEQRSAVGIQIGHPVPMKAPETIDALGTILDPATLIAEMGELKAARTAERAAAAEHARVRGLFEAGAAASQRMLQSAELESTRARAQSQSLAAQFSMRWGPLATLPPDVLDVVSQNALAGRTLLVRADVLGRNTLSPLPQKAALQVEGLGVPGRILGPLRRSADQQGTGLLIEVRTAPAGVGAGARLPVVLYTDFHKGMFLPRDSLLYDEHGAYVYKQLRRHAGDTLHRFTPVKVDPILSVGDGWLVNGVEAGDDIVVRGAGVLWSLQERTERSADTDVD